MLILYIGDKHFSGWSMRGRVAVIEKQVDYVERLVELDWPTTENAEGVLVVGDGIDEREAHAGCECEIQDLLELDIEGCLGSSHATALPRVPTLVDTEGGVVASDVVAIAEYLDEMYPDSGERLMGQTARDRALVRSVSSWAHCDLGSLVYGASFAKSLRPQHEQIDPSAALQCQWICDTVERLIERSGGPFIIGSFSLADVMLSTYFQQMRGWDFLIDSEITSAYSRLLLNRPTVAQHIAEAKEPYDLLAAATEGSPEWIVRHYRYNDRYQILHDWQRDSCVRIRGNSARLAISLAYEGRTLSEITGAISEKFEVPVQRCGPDLERLFNELSKNVT